MKTAIISLGRTGDVISILPCCQHIASHQGEPVAVVVSEPFADVLEGCSYVKPVVYGGGFTDTDGAIEWAHTIGYRDIRVGRINEKSIGISTQCGSFTEEMWRQLGCLDLWDRLRLVFDRRDFTREAALMQLHRIRKPFGLYNFSGKSSPFPQGEAWLARNLPMLPAKSWYDLGQIQAHRIYDLLGLMDEAEMLITCDSAPLHLAAASKVPTINFIQCSPTPWHGSLPRNNNVLSMRYDQVKDLTDTLNDALCRAAGDEGGAQNEETK